MIRWNFPIQDTISKGIEPFLIILLLDLLNITHQEDEEVLRLQVKEGIDDSQSKSFSGGWPCHGLEGANYIWDLIVLEGGGLVEDTIPLVG